MAILMLPILVAFGVTARAQTTSPPASAPPGKTAPAAPGPTDAGQSGAGQSGAGQSGAGKSGAAKDDAHQNGAHQNGASQDKGQQDTKAADQIALSVVTQSDDMFLSAVAAAPDHRLFVLRTRLGATGSAARTSLALLGTDGSLASYPEAGSDTGGSTATSKPSGGPINPTALRLAPDGSLWVAYSGVPEFGQAPLAGAAELVRIDLKTNQITHTYPLPADVLTSTSLIGDLRLHGGRAYLGDAGSPGLIVLDLATGATRRVLDHDPAAGARRPLRVSSEIVKGADGKPVLLDAGPLALSPDGAWLYFQPPCGPLSRVPTALLDDPHTRPEALAAAVEFWYDTAPLGGIETAADGSLLLSDLDGESVLRLTTQRVLSTLIQDPRLHGATVPALSGDTLYLAASQFDRAAPFHRGHAQFHPPMQLLALHLPHGS